MRGNYVGPNANGSAAVPNGDSGIRALNSFEVIIGGFDPDEGNVISGNLDHRITIVGLSEDIVVFGNRIGTIAAGTAAIGNGPIPW